MHAFKNCSARRLCRCIGKQLSAMNTQQHERRLDRPTVLRRRVQRLERRPHRGLYEGSHLFLLISEGEPVSLREFRRLLGTAAQGSLVRARGPAGLQLPEYAAQLGRWEFFDALVGALGTASPAVLQGLARGILAGKRAALDRWATVCRVEAALGNYWPATAVIRRCLVAGNPTVVARVLRTHCSPLLHELNRELSSRLQQ